MFLNSTIQETLVLPLLEKATSYVRNTSLLNNTLKMLQEG